MLTRREVIEGAVEQISMNLIQLVKVNEKLSNYKLADPNVLDLRKDTQLVDLLDATVMLREKIVEILDTIEPLVRDSQLITSAETAISDLKTLAEYYVYAGVKADRRIANKYRRLIVVEGVDNSISNLYQAFLRILNALETETTR